MQIGEQPGTLRNNLSGDWLTFVFANALAIDEAAKPHPKTYRTLSACSRQA